MAVAAIAASHGRRCTAWLQRAAGESLLPSAFGARRAKGSRRRSTLGPRYDTKAGSSVIEASITTSTASEAAMATPYM
jgi:hypothetical protein